MRNEHQTTKKAVINNLSEAFTTSEAKDKEG